MRDPASSTAADTFYQDDYLQTASETGPVTVRLVAAAPAFFDTFLSIYDAVTGERLAENDNVADGIPDSEIEFTAEAGRHYLIRCTSARPEATGTYSVELK